MGEDEIQREVLPIPDRPHGDSPPSRRRCAARLAAGAPLALGNP
jgi:hypothetical protein